MQGLGDRIGLHAEPGSNGRGLEIVAIPQLTERVGSARHLLEAVSQRIKPLPLQRRDLRKRGSQKLDRLLIKRQPIPAASTEVEPHLVAGHAHHPGHKWPLGVVGVKRLDRRHSDVLQHIIAILEIAND